MFIIYDVLYLLIKQLSHIKASKCSTGKSLRACRHQERAIHLEKENKSLKAKGKIQKYLLKEKDKEIAKHKWDAIQARKRHTVTSKELEKSKKIIEALKEDLRIAKLPKNSLKNAPLEDKKVRLLGVGTSNFELAAEKKKDKTPIQLTALMATNLIIRQKCRKNTDLAEYKSLCWSTFSETR